MPPGRTVLGKHTEDRELLLLALWCGAAGNESSCFATHLGSIKDKPSFLLRAGSNGGRVHEEHETCPPFFGLGATESLFISSEWDVGGCRGGETRLQADFLF